MRFGLLLGLCLSLSAATVDAGCAMEVSEAEAGSATAQSAPLSENAGYRPGDDSVFISNSGEGVEAVSIDRGVTRRMATAEELEVIARERAAMVQDAPPRAARRPARSMTERAVDEVGKRSPNELVIIGIELAEVEFDFSRMHDTSASSRQALVEERRSLLAPSQNTLAARINAIGGEVLDQMWLLNVVDVRVPAREVAAIAKWPGVVAISTDEPVVPDIGWNGRLYRAGLLVEDADLSGGDSAFLDGCYPSPSDPDTCHDGNTNSNEDSGAQRIAIIELGSYEDPPGTTVQNKLQRNHVGWKDSASGSSRVKKVMQCDSTSCTDETGSTATNTHGTRVTWVAAGSIEQGQDTNFPGTHTNDQIDRSGISGEASIYYYRFSGTSGARRAVDQAVADGADIINMSWTSGTCDDASITTETHNSGSLNQALRNALNAGTLPVKSAGNSGDDGSTCTIGYPAWRPHVLTVSGLQSVTTQINMNLLDRYVSSSRGGPTYQLLASPTVDRNYSGIGLAAPACIDDWFGNDSNGYTSGQRCGTSYATPAVAGVAALLRDALYHVGWNATAADARRLMVMMLLMGDAWESDGTVNSWKSSGVSRGSGMGRLHPHWPHADNMTAPWGWGNDIRTIQEGEVLTWPVGGSGAESTSVTQWKWVVTWFEDNLEGYSDIILRVRDSCNGNELISWDYSWDMRKRIHLRAGDIGGKCLVMEAVANQTPAGGTALYTTDYYHGGDAGNEH